MYYVYNGYTYHNYINDHKDNIDNYYGNDNFEDRDSRSDNEPDDCCCD
jgi:hypothetical protein